MRTILNHVILILGCLFLILPLWVAFASSTHTPETLLRHGLQVWFGDQFWATYKTVLFETGGVTKTSNAARMLMNSLVLGLGFAVGKIVMFWLIFLTLLLPLEVRIVPSYAVVAHLGLLNTYTGLILPLIASATGTFFFRQFYKSVPDELLEAARLDGAGPIRFFIDILLPLSKTMIAAIFIIMFVVGWNQYLWPLLMTTDDQLYTIVIGIKQAFQMLYEGGEIPQVQEAFALAILAVIPPVLVVLIFQRWFIRGLLESEK